MGEVAHKKDCPTQIKPPRKPGKCTCGVARDKWLETYATLVRAMGKTKP